MPTDSELHEIARQFFCVRRLRNWSQEYVALEADMSVRTYRRLESGAEGSSLGSVVRAMRALDMNVIDLPSERTALPSRIGLVTASRSSLCQQCKSADNWM
ncbi:helix-turn-helix domain-containing protein [Microbacterium sp.]|uniref:helix-turn-helix domain-containing protein n=1 Tax=Microbacterium sp. TaxID=51671 RepID=UPI0039189821